MTIEQLQDQLIQLQKEHDRLVYDTAKVIGAIQMVNGWIKLLQEKESPNE